MPGATLAFNDTVGNTIPPDTSHAVSVSLPTWESNVGYEKGERWVTDKMKCGYPRFFIHPLIQDLASTIVALHGSTKSEKAMLFPTHKAAVRCVDFIVDKNQTADQSLIRIIDFGPIAALPSVESTGKVLPRISAVIYPNEFWPSAKVYWQHSGDGISSRRAEVCSKALAEHTMSRRSSPGHSPPRKVKGPRRYQRPMSTDDASVNMPTNGNLDDHDTNGVKQLDSVLFVEERFGRNLDVSFACACKLAVRRRIAGSLTNASEIPESLNHGPTGHAGRSRDVPGFSVDDVYLFSTGMNAIFTSHRIMRLARGEMKSIMYGFPYVDTLKILENWGAGVLFFGMSSAAELDDLERRLGAGERYLALFCEFPGNPLLTTPDLKRIRRLADKYDFGVVVDETIGNFLNVHVLPYADVVVSSLTKIFSGDSNVMGGSLILNPRSRYYETLKDVMSVEFEDNLFEEDSVYLERNSRDFISRIQRVNYNAEMVADTLRAHPKIKQVNYPKHSSTRQHYEACKLPDGGYGGLLSCTFYNLDEAAAFYDHLDTQKGPSLGTNFTLSSPFVILAHFNELDWAAKYGCDASLIRFSIGLEDTGALKASFDSALASIGSRED
nr:hypothetical protein B0A51_09364 [Rachicladosporium sp. CCFEE 5018]